MAASSPPAGSGTKAGVSYTTPSPMLGVSGKRMRRGSPRGRALYPAPDAGDLRVWEREGIPEKVGSCRPKVALQGGMLREAVALLIWAACCLACGVASRRKGPMPPAW